MALPVPLAFTVKAPPADPTPKAAVSAEAAGNALRAHFKEGDGAAAVATVADLLGGCVAALAPLGIAPAPHRDDGSGTETASQPTHEFRVFVAAAPPLQLHHRGRPQQDRTLLSDLLRRTQQRRVMQEVGGSCTVSMPNTATAVLAVHIAVSAVSTNRSAGSGARNYVSFATTRAATAAAARCPYVPEKEDALTTLQQQRLAMEALFGAVEDDMNDSEWNVQCGSMVEWNEDVTWSEGMNFNNNQQQFQTTRGGNRWENDSNVSDTFSLFD